MIKLSQEQQLVCSTLLDWHKTGTRKQFITLGGYAGTGKTTLIGHFRKLLHTEKKGIKVAFCSYTGKASRVLRSKLLESKSVLPQDFIGTIHSLMYSPIVDDHEVIIGWQRKPEIEYDLIIIDEASMVNEEIWDDLLDYEIPLIAVGDHGQLPPVRGAFNLMETPQLKLEQIHRQAEGNPIIQLSIVARTEGNIPYGRFGNAVCKLSKLESETREKIESLLSNYNRDTLILCGYNNTRVRLNKYIRNALEKFHLTPQVGDRIICLRNNHTKEVYNGMLGTICSITQENEDWYFAEIEMDGEDEIYKGSISVRQFDNPVLMNFSKKRSKVMAGDLFDFGYALTVHKAQGSQAKRVILFEERFKQMDDGMWRRWLYTAITRAEEELFIIGK